MDRERWQRVEEIFQTALDYDGATRHAYLDTVCAEDEELRREVESLLEHDERAGDTLQAAVAEAAQGVRERPENTDVGRTIGPYVLVQPIGHGGMGSVYLAVRADDQYLQAVAIKLVRKGMDSDFILSRFRNERQILANLHHPHIAAILDGGTTEDGRPYFVMEYIQGEPIVDYAETRQMGIRQRLDLFRAVCAAVHHAHQKLVIHRDIKPGNILVTPEGVPKLLDFGIAKLLVAELAGSQAQWEGGVRMMTPDYASPEQVRGEAITTASDVYSLGVLLYELLTGSRPHRLTGISAVDADRLICEEAPPRASEAPGLSRAQRGKLRGDLDAIVQTAMRKDPAERYATVERLADDLENYVQDLTVAARKPSFGYRTGKLLRRHRATFASGALVLLLLASALVSTWLHARVADQRWSHAQRLTDTMLFSVHDQIRALPGAGPARRTLEQAASQYLDALAATDSSDQDLLPQLAEAYERLGDRQALSEVQQAGDLAGAARSYRQAIRMRAGGRSGQPGQTQRLMSLQRRLAEVLAAMGDHAGARASYQAALHLALQLGSPPDVAALREALAALELPSPSAVKRP